MMMCALRRSSVRRKFWRRSFWTASSIGLRLDFGHVSAESEPHGFHRHARASNRSAATSTDLRDGAERRRHRVWQQQPRPRARCVVCTPRCRCAVWLWQPLRNQEARPAGSRRPLWLALHSAAARFARLRSIPRQPNPQRKEQHQENSRSSLPFSFSPCSLIESTTVVSEMLARRVSQPL